jgi:hypothetical protein
VEDVENRGGYVSIGICEVFPILSAQFCCVSVTFSYLKRKSIKKKKSNAGN